MNLYGLSFRLSDYILKHIVIAHNKYKPNVHHTGILLISMAPHSIETRAVTN